LEKRADVVDLVVEEEELVELVDDDCTEYGVDAETSISYEGYN
jgi:hypothetical protein